MTDYTKDDAFDALKSLDPGVPRSDWVRIGMAAKEAGLSLDDFINWSSHGGNFDSAKDCKQVWDSFEAGGISAGTLFYLARQEGWQPESFKDRDRSPAPPTRRNSRPHQQNRGIREDRRQRSAAEKEKALDPEMLDRMSKLYSVSSDADEMHAYLLRKNIDGRGLRSVKLVDVVRFLGYHPKNKDGELAGPDILLVPLRDDRYQIKQLEMIDPNGRKILLPLPRQGLMFAEEPIHPETPIVGICEGLATSKTLMRTRYHPVVAASAANNLPVVAEHIRKMLPKAEIIIFADLGADGQKFGQRAADIVFGVMVSPNPELFEDPDGVDFNDMAEVAGDAAVSKWIEPRCTHPQRVTFTDAAAHLLPIDFVLPSLVVASVGLIVGPGSVGKSFLALEFAMSVALGRNLLGIPGQFEHIVPGRTAMLFGEDDRSIINNRMHHITALFRLTDREIARLDRDMLILSMVGEDMRVTQVDMRSVQEGPFLSRLRSICIGRRVAFIDPLIRLHDSDENDNTAASHLMLSIQRIARDTNCAIVLLHHSGKGQQEGQAAARGASAITTTARWQLNVTSPRAEDVANAEIKADETKLWVKCDGVKMNYGENIRHFWLRRQDHGVLRHADPAVHTFLTEPGQPIPSAPRQQTRTGNLPRGLQRPFYGTTPDD